MKNEQEWKAHFEAQFKGSKQCDDEMWRLMIAQIQSDALRHASNQIAPDGNPEIALEKIEYEINRLVALIK